MGYVCNDNVVDQLTKQINISVPTYFELISPGSNTLSDTLITQTLNTYPVFQWNTDYCSNCDFAIKVCQFNPDLHSSLQDALEDYSVLPAETGYYNVGDNLKVIQDFQVQKHDWNLNQKKIGYAFGHNLSALWQFLNPRFGLVYSASDELSVFINYGIAQKEPADNQIIEADDVWSTPVIAAAEVISNLETGWSMDLGNILINLNAYHILYINEQLKNIDVKFEVCVK